MSSRPRYLLLVCAVLACSMLFSPQPAQAQDAGAVYEKGMDAYFAGDYADAILSFKEAYAIEANPIFLFNMSIAYEKAGNYQEALKEAQAAQADGSLPPEAAQVNAGRIPSLSTIVKSREVAGRVSGKAPCQSNDQCREGFTCDVTSNMCVEAGPVADKKDGGDQSTEPFLGVPFSTIGWIGAGASIVGVGLLATTLIVDLGLGGDIEEYDALSDSDKRTAAGEALAEDIEGQQSTGQVLLYSGAGLVAVGAGLIVFDLFFNDGNEHMTNVGVGVSPDGASVQATWQF